MWLKGAQVFWGLLFFTIPTVTRNDNRIAWNVAIAQDTTGKTKVIRKVKASSNKYAALHMLLSLRWCIGFTCIFWGADENLQNKKHMRKHSLKQARVYSLVSLLNTYYGLCIRPQNDILSTLYAVKDCNQNTCAQHPRCKFATLPYVANFLT